MVVKYVWSIHTWLKHNALGRITPSASGAGEDEESTAEGPLRISAPWLFLGGDVEEGEVGLRPL